MADLTLITANKNYCLWPLPVWLCLKIAELEFDEIVIPFGDPDARERFLQLTPMGSVSALKHGDLTLWDSLAICEYVAELSPEAGLWPDERSTRAMARSVVADIHSASGAHRSGDAYIDVGVVMPTNIRQWTSTIDVPADIQQIFDRNTKIWRDCRKKYSDDGPFLFGRFSIADAMSAPLVNRFVTYNVPLGDIEAEYRDTMRAQPQIKQYIALAEQEPWFHEYSERPFR
jgi:glutathione S-transferase